MSLINLHTSIGDSGNDDSLVDVVAIHGLAQDGNGTWTDASTGVNWLRQFLPSASKGALRPRIFSYNYRADVSTLLGKDASNNILQHAHTLVSRLQAERSLTETSTRPLLFICHGVGGILLKRALAFSATQVSNKVTHNYSLYISTFGILFLGTPHHGLENAALHFLLQGQYGPGEFDTIMRTQHEILQDISDQFAPLIKQFHIFFFWEQMKTKFEQQSIYVVREDSAAPLWDNTERSAINATHSQMCKFAAMDDSDFRTIFDALLRYSRAAQHSIPSRWQNARRYLATQRSIEASELVGFNVHENNRPFVFPNTPKTPEWEAQRLRNKYFHVPHHVSKFFTGQGSLYLEVEQRLLTPRKGDVTYKKRVYVLYGLGGSGKTQFCLKFIEDHRDNFWAIFWVDASSIANAERALSHIGKIGGLGDNHQAGIYWLTGLDMPWMLVIDNADDDSIDYSRFFPAGDQGHILLTSRLQDCRVHATVGYHEFRNMEEEDAITLLLRAAYDDVDDADAAESRKTARPIVQSLGYLPLALTQAGASIRQKLCTLEDYLEVYDSHMSELMKCRPMQSSDSYQHSIYTTWEVTVRRIEDKESKTAIDAIQILQIFAFLHFDQLPVILFERAWHNIHRYVKSSPPRPLASKIAEQCSRLPLFTNHIRKLCPAVLNGRQQRLPRILLESSTSWDSFRFREALVMLEKHSLIYRDSGKEETYSMHPMVHSWARDRLSVENQQVWSDIAINTIACSISPELEPAQHQYRIALIPHVTAALKRKHSRTLMKGMESDYQILKSLKFASVYAEGGNWKEASQLQERIIKIRKSAEKSLSSETLGFMLALADSYWNLDQIAKSLHLLREVVDTSTSTLGAQDPKTLRAMDKLAATMWLCGQRAKAKELSDLAVHGLEKILSPDHPYTLDAMDTLGRTLMHTGHASEAAALHSKVLDHRERRLGLNHPDTLMAMANLGMSYHGLKDFSRAEELLDTVFHERSRILGEEHAYTLWAINDLSKIRCDRGYPIEAEVMLTEIIPTVIRTLGEDHVGMSMTKYNLAQAYMAQERWTDAKRVLLEITGIQKKKMPAEHPDRIRSAMLLATVTKQLGQVEESKDIFRDVIDLAVTVHGMKDARTRNAIGQLSAIFLAQGNFSEADKLDAKLRETAAGVE